MARTVQHAHDDTLTPAERATSAKKCLQLLTALPEATRMAMNAKDYAFYRQQKLFSNNVSYEPSFPQLDWLRGLVDRYVTGT